jgi:hypothetical protein
MQLIIPMRDHVAIHQLMFMLGGEPREFGFGLALLHGPGGCGAQTTPSLDGSSRSVDIHAAMAA